MTVPVLCHLIQNAIFLKFRSSIKCSAVFKRNISCNRSLLSKIMDDMQLISMCKQLAPPLSNGKYKGQAGKIGVVGGSLEYTGAPYFAAISSLKVGADLVHVFCPKEAAMAIKAYSPELMVHPILDDPEFLTKMESWFDRLNVVLIGPGLGRETKTFEALEAVINLCRRMKKPLVIDADALFFIAHNPQVIINYPYPGVILTPNAMEYARLLGLKTPGFDSAKKLFCEWGNTVTILCKGAEDKIMNHERTVLVSGGGSGRRCGGQGDLLGGALATFYAWALELKNDEKESRGDSAIVACYAACRLTRECNAQAFKKHGRSMLCSDMINEIHFVFEEFFEIK